MDDKRIEITKRGVSKEWPYGFRGVSLVGNGKKWSAGAGTAALDKWTHELAQKLHEVTGWPVRVVDESSPPKEI